VQVVKVVKAVKEQVSRSSPSRHFTTFTCFTTTPTRRRTDSMTTNHTDAESDAIIAAGLSAVDQWREHAKAMEEAKASQPERLVKARSEEARGWALLEETLDGQVKSLTSVDGAASLALPNMHARELWGARLAFDLLDCGDDFDEIDAVIGRLFTAAGGDPGVTMVIMSAALSTTAALIVPQLLDEIEHRGSNWDERVRLCEARAKAWNGRVSELRDLQDDAAECGVKPVDGYDIAATALDPEEQ
jgi:hypothetical protein